MSRVTLHNGDCLDYLRTLDAGSVDAVVTDPPAGISFMGKAWDKPGVLGVSGGVALPLDVEPARPPCPECGGKGRPGWPESAIDSKCRYCMGTGLSAEPQPQPPTARPSAAQREMFS
jgi:hypothetical protein